MDLADRLAIERFAAVGLLECLWHATAQHHPDGQIGRWSNRLIARAVYWTFDPDVLVKALTDSGFFDINVAGGLVVHDWPSHCDDTTHRFLARKRRLFADGTPPRLSSMTKEERMAYTSEGNTSEGTASPLEPSRATCGAFERAAYAYTSEKEYKYSSGRSSPSDRTDARVSQNGKAAGRGSRLPEQPLPEAWKAFAETLTLQAPAIYEQFCDYWRGVSGARGTKVDWLATWRNWCRTEARRQPGRNGGGMRRYPEAATPVIPSVDATRQMLRAKGLVG